MQQFLINKSIINDERIRNLTTDNRTILAFYRHQKYALKEWPEYAYEMSRFFSTG